MFKFSLGKMLKDVVTGFTGVATSRTEYLNGCIRYMLEPRVDKDGKMPGSKYFDEANLMAVKGGLLTRPKLRRTGGPQRSDPPSRR